MSSADPFLPVPDPAAESDSDVLPDDDRLELERVEDGSTAEGDVAKTDDVARPALFTTPAPADALDRDELRGDLGID